MTDYMKSLNNYFSNLPKLNTAINMDGEYSNLNTKVVNISNYTYVLSFLAIMIIFVIFSFFNISFLKKDNDDNPLYKLLEILIISFGLVVTMMVLLNYLLGIDVSAKLDIDGEANPNIEIVVENEMLEPPVILKNSKEVFHLPQNIYKYKDAKAVCKAYDSELADIKDVQKAHKDGAEWCSYGWSKNQMALFPTQHKTWEKLQKTDKYKNICGRPGVNGGYIEDPNRKYGVNCYGYKPEINSKNRKYMDNLTLYPNNINNVKDKEMQYYKDNIHNIIVAPFNSSEWNS
tara:strand:- start:1512 stop:2375 length:864 start_codon:yes stop_codon:yes gene_type:complete